ncbi:MAG: hypothetical protein ACYS80_13365 [Planctomycetota bacterium]|jgi:hypothetical protein
MIKSNTVLVLGAGASAPFGFPTGQGLKDRVCDIILTPQKSEKILEPLGFKTEEIASFRSALLNCGRTSVDAFLEYREDLLDIGKVAIAAALLPFETTDRLFSDWIPKRMDSELSKEGNWYDLLFGALADGVPFDEFHKNSLSIITFNYDRSLEHYLFTSLKNSYNKTGDECGEKLRKIDIVHVHGSLGPLNWQSRPVDLPYVPYDSGTLPAIVKLAADNIMIVHEGIADTPEFIKARNLLLSSAKIMFLGFGYHPVNLKRLGIGTLEIKHNNIWGTSYLLSLKRKKHIGKLITILSDKYNYLQPENVYDFLYKHVIL